MIPRRLAMRASYPVVHASLPHHADVFTAKRAPISRIGLERRLALLPVRDREEIAAIESVLSWEAAHMFADDAAFLAHADRVVARLRSARVRSLVAERLAMRSVLAALRWRESGRAAPPHRSGWGRTQSAWRIETRWSEADFGLGQPWVQAAVQHMRAEDPLGVERVLLGEVWRRLTRRRPQSDFEAMVIYVLKWNAIDRWTHHDAGVARMRFLQLLDGALGEGAPRAAAP